METLTNTEILRLKPEKDDSDTQSAVNYAIEHGAGKIMILGATGNRIDHLMANFGLLMLGKSKNVQIILADKYNYMCLIENGTILKKEEQVAGIIGGYAGPQHILAGLHIQLGGQIVA